MFCLSWSVDGLSPTKLGLSRSCLAVHPLERDGVPVNGDNGDCCGGTPPRTRSSEISLEWSSAVVSVSAHATPSDAQSDASLIATTLCSSMTICAFARVSVHAVRVAQLSPPSGTRHDDRHRSARTCPSWHLVQSWCPKTKIVTKFSYITLTWPIPGNAVTWHSYFYPHRFHVTFWFLSDNPIQFERTFA